VCRISLPSGQKKTKLSNNDKNGIGTEESRKTSSELSVSKKDRKIGNKVRQRKHDKNGIDILKNRKKC